MRGHSRDQAVPATVNRYHTPGRDVADDHHYYIPPDENMCSCGFSLSERHRIRFWDEASGSLKHWSEYRETTACIGRDVSDAFKISGAACYSLLRPLMPLRSTTDVQRDPWPIMKHATVREWQRTLADEPGGCASKFNPEHAPGGPNFPAQI
jgi:hypothetical protein